MKHQSRCISILKIFSFGCLLLASQMFSQQSFQLTVLNGYGSGVYNVGDTVHIWSKAIPADSVFDGWGQFLKSMFIARPHEWHTTLMMPNSNTQVWAKFIGAPRFPFHEETIQGVNVTKTFWWYAPANPKGVIIACHGTGGSGRAWTRSLENLQFSRDAVSRGFAVLSTDAEEITIGDIDGNGKLRWLNRIASDNVDAGNISIMLNALRSRGAISPSTPVFVMGMSAGGSFSPTLGFLLNVKATAIYCAEGLKYVMDTTRIPNRWNNARFDDNEETDNAGALLRYQQLQARGVVSAFDLHDRSPLYPERFLRIPTISFSQSQTIFGDLQRAHVLDGKNYLAMTTDSLVKLALASPQLFPSLALLTNAERSDVVDQLRAASANHQFFSDFNFSTLKFFERFLLPTNVVRERFTSENGSTFSFHPNPVSDFMTISTNANTSSEICIVDLLGREAWNGNVQERNTIDLRGWKRGCYVVRCGVKSVLIIKQ